jgi:hypothetical protein
MPLQSDQLNQKQLHILIYLPTYVQVSGVVTFDFSFPITTPHALKNLTHKRRKKNYHIATTSLLSLWQAERRTPNWSSKEFV